MIKSTKKLDVWSGFGYNFKVCCVHCVKFEESEILYMHWVWIKRCKYLFIFIFICTYGRSWIEIFKVNIRNYEDIVNQKVIVTGCFKKHTENIKVVMQNKNLKLGLKFWKELKISRISNQIIKVFTVKNFHFIKHIERYRQYLKYSSTKSLTIRYVWCWLIL